MWHFHCANPTVWFGLFAMLLLAVLDIKIYGVLIGCEDIMYIQVFLKIIPLFQEFICGNIQMYR
jgi:hypothetical protein